MSIYRNYFDMSIHYYQWRIQDFPQGGAPTLKVGARTYFFGRKPHENERILAPGGGARPWRPPLDPPLITAFFGSRVLVNTRES